MPTDWEKIEMKNIALGNGVYDIIIQKGDVPKIELISGTSDVPIYNQFAFKNRVLSRNLHSKLKTI